jgi:hypothetical protein
VIETESHSALIDKRALEELMENVAPDSGLLLDGRKIISSSASFPGISEPWIYAQNGRRNSAGEAVGFLGLRRNKGHAEVRIEYELRHTFESDRFAPNAELASHFLFQDRLPNTSALVFLIPFVREDHSEHYLAVVYQLTELTHPTNAFTANAELPPVEAPSHPKAPSLHERGPARSTKPTPPTGKTSSSKWQPKNPSDTNVQAVVHILHFEAPAYSTASLQYSAEVPPGYALQGNATIGTVHTVPDLRGHYTTVWIDGGFSSRPLPPLRPGDSPSSTSEAFSLESLQAQQTAVQTQLEALQNQGPIQVILGQRKQLFSVTNHSGEVWQGFFELIRQETNTSAIQINPMTGLPGNSSLPAGMDNQVASLDEQKALLEMQKAKLAWTKERTQIILDRQPPIVVETFPTSGSRDVPPGVTEIRVRFSKPMQDDSWSWTTLADNSTPESLGPPHFLNDHRTCILKVRLEPGHTYAWWLNSASFKNFQDTAGIPAVPYLLIFQTKPQ